MERNTPNTPTGRDIYNGSLSGEIPRPFIPPLRSDPPPQRPLHTLQEFRDAEGRENRKRRLQDLWKRLPNPDHRDRGAHVQHERIITEDGLTPEKAEELRAMYDDELMGHCGAHPSGSRPSPIGWRAFKEYAEAKEVGTFCTLVSAGQLHCPYFSTHQELWSIFHDELDLDGNGHLDAQELTSALTKAGERTT